MGLQKEVGKACDRQTQSLVMKPKPKAHAREIVACNHEIQIDQATTALLLRAAYAINTRASAVIYLQYQPLRSHSGRRANDDTSFMNTNFLEHLQ